MGPLFLLIMLSTLSYFISVGALIPTLPRFIEGPLGGSDVAVGVGVAAFSLTAVLFRPFVGRISDERGRRLVLISGGLLVGASTFAYVFASSLPMLIFLRLVAGTGEAAFYVGAASVINDLAPDERRGEAFSYFSLALFGGLAVGPLIGESVLEVSGFDAAWLVAGATAFAAGLLGFRLSDTRPERTEVRASSRLIHPAGLRPGLVLAASIVGLAGFNTFVPLYALSIGMSGSRVVFMLNSALVLVVRFFGARIPDQFGPRKTLRVALLSSAIGFSIMAAVGTTAGLLAGTVFFAIGHSLTFPALMTMAIGGAPPNERGAVVGTFTAFFDLAFGSGAVLLGFVADGLGYNGVFATSAVVALAGLGIVVQSTRGRPRSELAAAD